MTARIAILLVLVSTTIACGGDSDPGLLDCPGYVDKQIECEFIPPQNAEALRDTNIQICNNWERTYKENVLTALEECVALPCDQLQGCTLQANQLCQADVSAEVDTLCVKVVECGWEEITNMFQCQTELSRNNGLYMCLRPDIFQDYIECVQGITCGPDSEDEWYGCGAEHIQ
jgi:hypothetical protein